MVRRALLPPMRVGWVQVALVAVLALFMINQYPAFGTDGIGVANDWAVTYFLAAIVLGALGIALLLTQATGRLGAAGELPLATIVLAGGLFLCSWLLQVLIDSGEAMYQIVLAVVTAVLLLGLVLSADRTRAAGPGAQVVVSGIEEPQVQAGEAQHRGSGRHR